MNDKNIPAIQLRIFQNQKTAAARLSPLKTEPSLREFEAALANEEKVIA
ncbi:MAG: hypothetical protein HY300_13430 [Verrucomicrobia bacterium]|nr:hypothetical protein [Verrucomicrobiota bacterium]